MKDPWLHKVCVALGWQGGTIHQVIAEIERLRAGEQGATTAVYLVATGEVHEGEETYTRYEGRPPPLCDFERLWMDRPATAPLTIDLSSLSAGGQFDLLGERSPPAITPAAADQQVDRHLDAVLRASGSALKHYTMQKSLADMRAAMRAAMAGTVL